MVVDAHDAVRLIRPTIRGSFSPQCGDLARACRQVLKHHCAGAFGLDERLEGGAADLDGGPVLMGGAPRHHKAWISVQAGTAAALIADHEREAAAVRTPYFHIFERSDDATELHAAPETPRAFHPAGVDTGVPSRKMQAR
jgi:hypothetical protein